MKNILKQLIEVHEIVQKNIVNSVDNLHYNNMSVNRKSYRTFLYSKQKNLKTFTTLTRRMQLTRKIDFWPDEVTFCDRTLVTVYTSRRFILTSRNWRTDTFFAHLEIQYS